MFDIAGQNADFNIRKFRGKFFVFLITQRLDWRSIDYFFPFNLDIIIYRNIIITGNFKLSFTDDFLLATKFSLLFLTYNIKLV